VYSLTRRLLVFVSIALAVFFGLTAVALDAIFRDLADRSLRELLDAQIVALIAAAETDVAGRVAGASTDADSRLQTPGSGLYAEIRSLDGRSLWRSPSAAGTFLDFTAPPGVAVPTLRFARLGDGTRVAIAGRGISWEYGQDRAVQQLVFAVATSLTPYDEQLRSFRTQLFAGLAAAALLVLGSIALLLRWLTSPMRRLEREIAAVETGRLAALGGGYPRELDGVTRAVNALLESERRRIARYRDTLGNLAHSLKTPLAVIRSALGGGNEPTALRGQVAGEVDRMQGIIEHQLQRAATSGGQVLGQEPVPIAPVVQELRAAMLKVHARKDFAIETAIPAALRFAGDRADLTEALGNLLDNACKWCRAKVRVEASLLEPAELSDTLAGRAMLRLRIEDDGSGIPDELRRDGPSRGRRADETTPGHGIGLAMVAEMADLYGGQLRLEVSSLGGARIDLILPAAVAGQRGD
jgi:two-component system sensor histidine kinase PhoQ